MRDALVTFADKLGLDVFRTPLLADPPLRARGIVDPTYVTGVVTADATTTVSLRANGDHRVLTATSPTTTTFSIQFMYQHELGAR